MGNEHPLDSLRQKMQALDAMEQEARQKQERDQPKNTFYNQVTESVWSMYVAGCPNGGSTKLFYPALLQIRNEAHPGRPVLAARAAASDEGQDHHAQDRERLASPERRMIYDKQ